MGGSDAAVMVGRGQGFALVLRERVPGASGCPDARVRLELTALVEVLDLQIESGGSKRWWPGQGWQPGQRSSR